MAFFRKVVDFIVLPTRSRTIAIVVILFLIAATALTVIVAQQQQTLKQRAANDGCGGCADGFYCEYNPGIGYECFPDNPPPPPQLVDTCPSSSQCQDSGCSNGWTSDSSGDCAYSRNRYGVDYVCCKPSQPPPPVTNECTQSGGQCWEYPCTLPYTDNNKGSSCTNTGSYCCVQSSSPPANNCSGGGTCTSKVNDSCPTNYDPTGGSCSDTSKACCKAKSGACVEFGREGDGPCCPHPSDPSLEIEKCGENTDNPKMCALKGYCGNRDDCPVSRPVRCSNGSCVASASQCSGGGGTCGTFPTCCDGQIPCNGACLAAGSPCAGGKTLNIGLNVQDETNPSNVTVTLKVVANANYGSTSFWGPDTPYTLTDSQDPSRRFVANIALGTLALVPNTPYRVSFKRASNNMIAVSLFSATGDNSITVKTTTLVFGDVNMDWKVNSADYEGFRQCWRMPATGSCAVSDINKDGKIDQIDYNTLLRGLVTWAKEEQDLQVQ